MEIKLGVDGTSTLRWLHLTDLHIGHKKESQRTAIASLVQAVERFAGDQPFDLVLLTGDLAYSGKREEYDAFEASVLVPLKALPQFRDVVFVAVPGNHDLQCEVGIPPSWSNLGPARQEAFFNLDEKGRGIRHSRALAFSEYQAFCSRCGIISVDPTTAPAQLDFFVKGDRRYAIVGVVTAFFCDKEVKDHRKAPAPVHPIRTLLQSTAADDIRLVLGHHPYGWFTNDSESKHHSLLVSSQALYLHGHEHSVRSIFGGRGLASLGLGAAYQAPQDNQDSSFYRNSFAICELEDALHVRFISWDGEFGEWRPDLQVPGDFVDRSDRLSEGFRLPMFTTRISDQATKTQSALSLAVKGEMHFEQCLWLTENDSKRWISILLAIGEIRGNVEVFSSATTNLPGGHLQFRIRDQNSKYLVRAISARGDILNYEQLQTINTELDKLDYDAVIVVTLGTLSQEARTLAAQLQARKSFTVLERKDLAPRLLRTFTPELSRAISEVDPATNSGSLLVTNEGTGLLLQDRTSGAWFRILSERGSLVPEADALVVRVRDELPRLRGIPYDAKGWEQQSLVQLPLPPIFDRNEYLDRCRSYFDDVKYAPLAALGFKFRHASLSEVYVAPSANVSGSSYSEMSLNRAVSEFLDSLQIPSTQRDQLESQLRSTYGLDRTAEVGAARQLYQRFNNVVVVGDPGSGKTCFVKHEILAYCEPPREDSSWYMHHLPVHVALAEAATLLTDGADLLEVCSIVSARRGIALPKSVLEEFVTEGRVAFFFDGLDEVGLIDKRIALVAEINSLLELYGNRGNRVVLTSRPAAVQPVDVPESLTYLRLKGLTEDEIRVLAARVLTVRLGEYEDSTLSQDELGIVDKLIEDTKSSPGIARIARNPLLLTLLVLIYANTGALSARRHLIYTQAIKTLVSVRGRQTREQQISEADLRVRLGALAVGIFRQEVPEIPKRSEVARILAPTLPTAATSTPGAVDAFLQEVAEATGLLSIHPQASGRSDDLITFMHYSFLEYYAAAGVLSQDPIAVLTGVAGDPRWREVVTLLFGVLSEQGDVTPALRAVLTESNSAEAITKYKLLLAIESASECDVPPEAAQELLSKAIYEAVSVGAGRFSADLRADIASALEHFLQGPGARIEAALLRGLADEDALVVAAFADLIARLPPSVRVSDAIVGRMDELALKMVSPVARCSLLYAIECRPELRTELAKGLITTALSRSLVEKHAALKVVGRVPEYAKAAEERIIALLDDPNGLVAATAAHCLLVNTLHGDKWLTRDAVKDKVLTKLTQSDRDVSVSLDSVTLDRGIAESMLGSDNAGEAELAIRYLPLIKGHDQFIHRTLVGKLRSNAPTRHKAAALDSLRQAPGAISLITIADTDLICELLDSPERNLRIATVRLLGEMPDDEQVVRSLQDRFAKLSGTFSRDDEGAEIAKALASHVRRSSRLRADVLRLIVEALPLDPDKGFGNSQEQNRLSALLLVCESIGGSAAPQIAQRLLSIAQSFKTPKSLRKYALRVFGRVAEPTPDVVETLITLLKRNDSRINDAVYAATLFFVGHCRSRVEYVRRVYASLAALRDQLCVVWRRETAAAQESIDPAGPRAIRQALVELEALMISFQQFAGRRTVRQGQLH